VKLRAINVAVPAKASSIPIVKTRRGRWRYSSHAASVTMTADRFASSVALATDVSLIDQCQNDRSPAKLRPTAMSAVRCMRLSCTGFRVGRDSRAHSQRAGAASATRQNADVIGPTSASRTKIGENPIAVAPRISAVRLNALFGEEEADAVRMVAGEDSTRRAARAVRVRGECSRKIPPPSKGRPGGGWGKRR